MAFVINPEAMHGLFHATDGPVAKALAQKAFQVENSAKRFAPVDTGRLRASITTVFGQDDQGQVALVGSNVEYCVYVETGTRFMQAQPFLRPALYGSSAAFPALPWE